MNKKIISLLLAFLMLVTIIPVNNIRAEDNVIKYATSPESATDDEYIPFEDDYLKKAIIEFMSQNGSYNEENFPGEITVGLARSIENLYLTINQNVYSYKGMEYFNKLNQFNIIPADAEKDIRVSYDFTPFQVLSSRDYSDDPTLNFSISLPPLPGKKFMPRHLLQRYRMYFDGQREFNYGEEVDLEKVFDVEYSNINDVFEMLPKKNPPMWLFNSATNMGISDISKLSDAAIIDDIWLSKNRISDIRSIESNGQFQNAFIYEQNVFYKAESKEITPIKVLSPDKLILEPIEKYKGVTVDKDKIILGKDAPRYLKFYFSYQPDLGKMKPERESIKEYNKVNSSGVEDADTEQEQINKWIDYFSKQDRRLEYTGLLFVDTKMAPDVIPAETDGSKPEGTPENYKLVEFNAGNNVSLKSKKDDSGKDLGSKFWVNPKVEVDLTNFTPDVEAEKSYSFEGWDKPLKGTFTENTVINAKINAVPFDKDNVVGMEIVSEPNKMSYKDGEELDLTGLKIKLIDKNDIEQIVDFEKINDYDITVEPVNKTVLTLKDNDKVITVKKTGLNDVTTKGKLSVTEKPIEDNRKDNEKYPAIKPNKTEVNDINKLTKEEKDKVAEEVKKANPKAKDIEVTNNGDTVITYPDGSTNELKQVDTVVQKKVEDKRKDNEKYPAQKPIRTAVEDKSDLTYREKERVTERIKDANPHALAVSVKDNGDATLIYADGSTNELKQRDTVYELGESRKPDIDKVYEGDKYITGKGEPYASIDIKLPNGKIISGSTDRYGYFKIKVPAKIELKEDDVLYVSQTEFESEESDRVKVTVLKNDKVDKKLKTEQHYAYIVGYPDGRFGPNDIITRAQTAMIFARLSRNQNAAPASYFSDINSKDWHAKAVGIGIQEGFIKGYVDGTFKPNQPMTRAEFASVISAFAEKETKRNNYKDVDGWAAGVIDTAYVNGWMQGDGRGYFRPNDYITRAEAVSVVNRMLKRKPDKEFIDKHILTSSTLFARPFTDVDVNSWYFYDVYAAAFGHDYKIKDKAEKWTELNGKVFTVR